MFATHGLGCYLNRGGGGKFFFPLKYYALSEEIPDWLLWYHLLRKIYGFFASITKF